MDFDEWWQRTGRTIDPDTGDVSWYDKQKAMAEQAWLAARAQSGNYVADDSVEPRVVTFANGRQVRVMLDNDLSIGWADYPSGERREGPPPVPTEKTNGKPRGMQ